MASRMIRAKIQRRTTAITTSPPNKASRVSTLNFFVACFRFGLSLFGARNSFASIREFGFRHGQDIRVPRYPHVEGRQQEDVDSESTNQPANDDNRKWTLRVRPDAM